MYGQEILDDYQFEIEFPFGLPDGNWYGKPIQQMDIKHINNCMNMVRDVDDDWYELFKKEMQRRRFGHKKRD